jgi:hypothetical protein
MCNDEAINVVIYSLNANIHVYVHEDLNEIYLYNVKCVCLLSRNWPSFYVCVSTW